MDGVIVIDKPGGMTSHDVVDEVRRRLKTRKVGHGGTLDPDATGVLVVGVGRATRLLSYSQEGAKRYTAVARFGITTSTQDASGEVVASQDATLTAVDVERALKAFEGEIEQVPPMVSAVKVGGERLYKKARRGETVERAPRTVTVYDIALTDFSSDGPRATLDVSCSAGTYVRTLVHDLGTSLGCGAHLESLRRTEAGGFTEADAVALDDVDERAVRPLIDAVRGLTRIEVDGGGAHIVSHGRPLHVEEFLSVGDHAAIVHDDRLIAVYRKDRERLVPVRVVGS
jgi:tRNA pseudouridine55 synthase